MENRNILIGLGTGLVAGFLLGYGTGTYFSTSQPHVAPPAAAAPTGMPPQNNPMAQNQVEAFGRITATKAALDRDPSNVDAWIALGNDYFDTHQPQFAVDAYAKAMAMAPKHPHLADILTDQGVMYRELKNFDKALANFKAANKLDPKHLPSLLNIGVVYGMDLHNPAEAKKSWNKIIELAPDSPQAAQAKSLIAGL